MQSLTWRFRRVLGMSPREIAWRARGALIDLADAQRAWRGRPPAARPNGHGGLDRRGFRVGDVAVGEWAGLDAADPAARWCRDLRAQADAARAHRLTLFGRERHLGDPIDWNREPESGRQAPLRPAMMVDYRDYDVVGDVKLLWEPNRHHHLVVLARAYRATGERAYAEAVRAQLASWLDQCPYGQGVNWRSPLELAIRLINWVWALDLVRESGVIDAAFAARVEQSAYLHLWTVARRYSRGSSANNHRIGEAAGVFVGSAWFCGFAESERWRAESWAMLGEEILAQTAADGGTREHALGYHAFALQFFLVAGVVAERLGLAVPASYRERLEKMCEFLAGFVEGGEDLPLFGDADDGYVLDLGGHGRPRDLMAAGAVLFGRADFAAAAGAYPESLRWLLGAQSRAAFDAAAGAPGGALESRSLAPSGYYLLQSGGAGQPDAVSVAFDCAELGFGAIAAHGHADALAFTLRAFGTDVLVDPGTYDYFRYPTWRDYFRSTRAHNTVVVDDCDQSVMQGPFLWGARAHARCLDWSPAPGGGVVRGEHDGYRRLPDPVTHRRTLALDGRRGLLTVRDELEAAGPHAAAVHFHFSERCRVEGAGPGRFQVDTGRGTVTLTMDPRLSVAVLRGSEDPIAGWVSRAYHDKVPGTTLIGRAEWKGSATFVCEIAFAASPGTV